MKTKQKLREGDHVEIARCIIILTQATVLGWAIIEISKLGLLR